MKRGALIISSLFLLVIIIIIINQQTKLTGYNFLEQYPEEIIIQEPQDLYRDPPYYLSAGCAPSIGCQNLSFYYFESTIIFNEKTKEIADVTKPKNLSDYILICRAESEDGKYHSCIWEFDEKDHSGDLISIIAIGKNKENSTIISNGIIILTGKRTKIISLLDSKNTPAVIISLIIFITILTFWLSNYILIKTKGANKNGA